MANYQVIGDVGVVVPSNGYGAGFMVDEATWEATGKRWDNVIYGKGGNPAGQGQIRVLRVASLAGPAPFMVNDLVADVGTWAFQHGGVAGVEQSFGVRVQGIDRPWMAGDHIYIKVRVTDYGTQNPNQQGGVPDVANPNAPKLPISYTACGQPVYSYAGTTPLDAQGVPLPPCGPGQQKTGIFGNIDPSVFMMFAGLGQQDAAREEARAEREERRAERELQYRREQAAQERRDRQEQQLRREQLELQRQMYYGQAPQQQRQPAYYGQEQRGSVPRVIYLDE